MVRATGGSTVPSAEKEGASASANSFGRPAGRATEGRVRFGLGDIGVIPGDEGSDAGTSRGNYHRVSRQVKCAVNLCDAGSYTYSARPHSEGFSVSHAVILAGLTPICAPVREIAQQSLASVRSMKDHPVT